MHRKYDISYKSALFMARPIRHAMRNQSFEKLTGTVEADATFVGGKTRRGHKVIHERLRDQYEMSLRPTHPGLMRGPPHPRMKNFAALGVIERSGSVRTQAMKSESGPEVRPILSKNVDLENVRLMTDASSAYRRISEFSQHDVVNMRSSAPVVTFTRRTSRDAGQS